MGIHSHMWLSLWKPVLSPMTRSLILSHKHKAWWMHYQIPRPQTARVKGSAFSSCFLQALWWGIRAVCGLDRALANQEMAVCGCTTPWCWIMTCVLKFLSVLSPEWHVTWPNSSIHISHKNFSHHLARLPGPRHLPPLEVAWYSQPRFKNYLKWQETLLLTTSSLEDLEGNTLL